MSTKKVTVVVTVDTSGKEMLRTRVALYPLDMGTRTIAFAVAALIQELENTYANSGDMPLAMVQQLRDLRRAFESMFGISMASDKQIRLPQ